MTKLELAKAELDKNQMFSGEKNQTALDLVSILDKDVPFTMAYTLANFTMASYIAHFHFKILIKDDNTPPANMICFILAKSGAKKTSSVVNLEKAFKPGFDMINNQRQARLDALLSALGEDADELPASQKRLTPLSNALGTPEGVIQMINDFKKEGLGLPNMVVDEIATELSVNKDIIGNIQLVAELFDDGNKKVKPLKDRENQSEEVVGMGVTALFIGSEHGLLEDVEVLKKFQTEFISKLARRCFFVYPEFQEEKIEYDSFDSILEEEDNEDRIADDVMRDLGELAETIASNSMVKDKNLIPVAQDALRMLKAYKIWCVEMSKPIISEPLNLEQQHRHWKVFKLSAVYALFNKHREITKQDVRQAITTAEMTSNDLGKFITKASRETYEILLEHFIDNDGDDLTIHEMIKLGWIKKQANLKDMLIAANSKLGQEGILEEYNDKVIFTPYEKTDTVGISYMKCEGTKDERKFKIVDGFKYVKSTFPKCGNVMAKDTAFTPFKFKDGVRGKEHIASGADFIMLDIDDSDITIHECADMLGDYKYVMAMTSQNNPYKFRVMMPIDIVLEIDGTRWLQLMRKISEFLKMKIDILPQSQIFYGYEGRELIVNEEGQDLEVSELLKELGERPPDVVPLRTQAQFDRAWSKRRDVFAYAYAGRKDGGQLHLGLYKAMEHACDLGFSYHENLLLLAEIIGELDEKPRDNFLPSLESQRKQAYIRMHGPTYFEDLENNIED